MNAPITEIDLAVLGIFAGQPRTLDDLMQMGAWQAVNGDRNAVLNRVSKLVKAGYLKKTTSRAKRNAFGCQTYCYKAKVNVYEPTGKAS